MLLKRRLTLLCLLFLLPALACDYVGVENIYGLSDEDFQLLYDSNPLITYWFDYEGDLEVAAGGESVILDMVGDGGFIQKDDQIVPDMQVLIDMSGQGVDGQDRQFQLELRYVENYFYMKARDVIGEKETSWAKMTLSDLLLGAGIGLPSPDSTGTSSPAENPFGDILGEGMISEDMLNADFDSFGLSPYTDIRRTRDSVVNGQDAATYDIEVDLAEALMGSLTMGIGMMENSELDMGEMGLPGMEGMDMSMITMFLDPLIRMILPKASIELDQYVSLETGLPLRSVTDMELEMNLSALENPAAMFGGPSASAEPELALRMYIDTLYQDFERELSIEVPADAKPMSLNEFNAEIDAMLSGN